MKLAMSNQVQRPASNRAPLAYNRPLLVAAPMPRPGARRRTSTCSQLPGFLKLNLPFFVRGLPAFVFASDDSTSAMKHFLFC